MTQEDERTNNLATRLLACDRRCLEIERTVEANARRLQLADDAFKKLVAWRTWAIGYVGPFVAGSDAEVMAKLDALLGTQAEEVCVRYEVAIDEQYVDMADGEGRRLVRGDFVVADSAGRVWVLEQDQTRTETTHGRLWLTSMLESGVIQ